MRIKDLRSLALFDGVTDEQLAGLAEGSTEIRVQPGLELFREGEHADFWWVLLEGVINLVRHIGHYETSSIRCKGASPLGRRIPCLGRTRRLSCDRPRGDCRAGAPGTSRGVA